MKESTQSEARSPELYKDIAWSHANPGNGESGVGLARAFLKLVSGLDNVRRICDLGCGNGHLAGALADLGYEVVGIDASETGIQIARQVYSKATFLQSLINSELGDHPDLGTFDLIVSSDVIEHLYRPADLLEAARSLLGPNGQLVIGTPYHGYLKNLVLGVTGKMDSHFTVLSDGGHIKFFSVATLSESLKSNGFSGLRFSYYGRAPWLWKNMICHARRTD
jgi:2-polyprenyl-3-methyl-5-hydroxy-6-metoxy-1,4-benzoquinol methylase